MKQGLVLCYVVCSFVSGSAVGIGIATAVRDHQNSVAPKTTIQQTCNWREEQAGENKKRVINCFSTLDGGYQGHVQEEIYGWNAYPPKKEDGKEYITFIDQNSAQKFVTSKVEAQ